MVVSQYLSCTIYLDELLESPGSCDEAAAVA